MKIRKLRGIKNGYGNRIKAGYTGCVLLFSLCIAMGIQNSVAAALPEQRTLGEREVLLGGGATGETAVLPEDRTAEAASGAAGQPEIALYARSAVLMDAATGRVLYEKNGYEHMPNASTTKIMTCILALEQGNLKDEVKVSSYASSMPRVRLGMSTDDTFRLRDLLYSLMLESHNDSAVAIAEHIAGSVEEFAKMMNQKARELGCKDTYFITPNGLDSKDNVGVHGTTAEDLAKIMSYCILNKEFLEITRTANYQFTNLAGTKSYSCNNHNAFLQMMDGALSGKTGFTGNAGYCYVGALEREGRTFVVALLACGWPNNKSYKWADTTSLMNYGLEQYRNTDICEYGKEFPPAVAVGAEPESGRLYEKITIPLRVKEEELVVLKREDEEVRTIYDVPENLQAPVEEGQQVGSVTYYLGERQIAEVPICAAKSVKKQEPSWYRDFLLKLFFMEKNFYFLSYIY